MYAPLLDQELFLEVVEGIVPPCESVYHGTGQPQAIHHEGPAAWIQLGHCPHITGYRCDKIVQFLMAREIRDPYFGWRCDTCNISDKPGRYIPLSDLR